MGTKIDCIAVLFVCVGFLFGKLIFLIIPDSVCVFFLLFPFFVSLLLMVAYTVMGTIYYLLYLPT